MRRVAAALSLTLSAAIIAQPAAESGLKPMSFSNRLLLNRAAVSGVTTLEVMLALAAGGVAETSRRIERNGGRILHSDAAVGYLRVAVATDKLIEAVGDPGVEAYQIASLSRGSWYRDGPPQSNADMYRGFERVIADVRPRLDQNPQRPSLSPEDASGRGYTGEEDAGVREWIEKHPTYDGRGVTIAMLETGQPEFLSSILGQATSLDGRSVPKLAGIINAVGADEPDDTRVVLDVEVSAQTAWNRIGDRTYAFPRSGRFRFGMFTLPVAVNLIAQFGVLQDEATHEVWVDANGNADFRDEAAVADVNQRFDPRTLKVPYRGQTDLGFVIGAGRAPHTLHVYASRGGHQTMTLSVAAGSRTKDSIAFGVAPGARVLLVRNQTPDGRLRDFIEGYLEAAKRPDVDLLSDSFGAVMVPDTAADFAGLLFHRIVVAYGKPIFHSAGNMSLFLGSVSALGDAFSVGGSIGPETFAALFGGASLPRLMIHPIGAAGPAIDGALKPDFVAPMHRVAADLASAVAKTPLPKNAATGYLPAGYQISCCTSSSGPYAAGIGALLLSAAKQEQQPYAYAAFARALRVAARFLPESPAHEQGSGVLDVNAAWDELKRNVDIPRIVSTANVVHPLAGYAARGGEGHGIFESEGWTAGMAGTRVIRFRRESGSVHPVRYRVSWTGNRGVFATGASIRLPLGETVSLPVVINVPSAGAHSAILNLHDPATDAVIFRTQATVVAAEQFDHGDRTVRLAGTLPLLGTRAHYLSVPSDIAAIAVELKVLRGSVRATVLPSHGLFPNYYYQVFPQSGRTFRPGTYHVTLPNPVSGTWGIMVDNTSALREPDQSLVSTEEAEYTLTVRLLDASLGTRLSSAGVLGVELENRGAPLAQAALQISRGVLMSHHGTTLATGLPNQFAIDVPAGAASLTLRLRGTSAAAQLFELYLYDCTTGECFSYNFTLPAAAAPTLVVRRPAAGRWIAAVNAAPTPLAALPFELDEVIATTPLPPTGLPHSQLPAAHWADTMPLPPSTAAPPGGTPVLLLELFDRAVDRDDTDYPWETRPVLPTLRDRPVAIGMSIHRLR
ncbi:MAG: serine protease [Acidobacteria bacterium]|nr:serine protease [Acidobacteriota bacterium]